MLFAVVRRIALSLGAAALGASLLAAMPSERRWVRVWDFPRMQLAALLALALAAALRAPAPGRPAAARFAASLAGALLWQLHRIRPYTRAHAVEAEAASGCEPPSRIRLLVANVLVENRDAGPLLALVRRVDPDVLLLVETDAAWDRWLQPLRALYPQVVAQPQDDSYGMHLFSRFELIDPEVRFLLDDYVPSIKTGLRLPCAARIDLYGVHPKPPPLKDTTCRDAELLIVAREIRRTGRPTIVAGDLNDVAWSRTSRLFQKTSGLLDPRIGRGLYSTFNARWPLLRWPLDHVFFAASFRLLDIDVMEDIGSDHFPLFVALCHAPGKGVAAPQPDVADIEEARRAIHAGREKAGTPAARGSSRKPS